MRSALLCLPLAVRRLLNALEARTRDSGGCTLTLALSYGGRSEIADACDALVKETLAGRRKGPVTEEDVLAQVTPRTRAAAFSWVSFCTGYRLDLGALPKALKARGVEFAFVDGMQGAGVWPPDLSATDVDFFSFQTVKWLAGPGGAGALYIRPELWRTLRNPAFSWYSVPCSWSMSHVAETGCPL